MQQAKPNKTFAILISLIVALGGFLLGFDSAVISGAIPFYKNTFGLDLGSWLIGFSVGSIILGAMLGNFIAGPIADAYGRKRALIATSILFTFCAIGTALANDIVFFILARIIGGIGVGMAILVAPMYIAEIAPRAMRGTLVTFNQLNIVLGISIAYFSNYFFLNSIPDTDLNWRWMLGIGVVPAVLYFLLLFLVPRSPRWLMTKGLEEEAFRVLCRVHGEEMARVELAEIRNNLEGKQAQENISYKAVFSRKMKTVLLIGFGIAFFQQITGINAIFYYAPMIFEMAGGGKDAAFAQAIILGLTNLLMTFVAMFLIDRLGRKPLLLIGATGIFISLSIASFAFWKSEYQITGESMALIEQEMDAASYQAISSALTPVKDVLYTREVKFFAEVKQAIGTDNYNQYKEIILKHSIRINSIMVLVGLLLFVASFAISLGPVMWTLLSEIFPNKLRGLAISIVGLWNSVVSFSVATVFPMELEFLGSSLTYFIYALFGFLTILFVARFVPETKGKSLEEIEVLLVH
jgi:sugar porter (SP) family MFS transporter